MRAPHHSHGPILIIEDEVEVREALSLLLTEDGFAVATAFDGQDAIDKITAGMRPCLIILDLLMPRVNGVEFCEALRRDRDLAEVPVIVCSAASDLNHRTRHLGVAVVFQKPLKPGVLLRAVREHC
jgi:two-component system chemotaxis response regulator CheY